MCLFGMDEALQASQIAANIGRAWRAEPAPPLLGLKHPSATTKTLSEADAKQALASFGVPIPAGETVSSVEDAISVARRVGYPVVAKALGIAHKTEHQAVQLNLQSEEAVRDSVETLLGLSQQIYIESMVGDNQLELILGISRDEQLGLVLTLGSGGILVEVLKDSATLLLPTTRESIHDALRGLRCAPLFDGYRGKPRIDLEASIDAILALQEYAIAQAAVLVELDINPLIIQSSGSGAVAADALIVKGDSHHE